MGAATPTASPRVEEIRAVLDDLIAQRRRLERAHDDEGLLEANRLGIVYWQLQLRRCLAEESQRRPTGQPGR